jgi:hypothetical protein
LCILVSRVSRESDTCRWRKEMIDCGDRRVPAIARHIGGEAVDYKKAVYARIHSCNEPTARKRVSCE